MDSQLFSDDSGDVYQTRPISLVITESVIRQIQELAVLEYAEPRVDVAGDVAVRILSALPVGTWHEGSSDAELLRWSVRSGTDQKTVTMRRTSLERLDDDPHRATKIECLRRHLTWSIEHGKDFSYPSAVRSVRPRPSE